MKSIKFVNEKGKKVTTMHQHAASPMLINGKVELIDDPLYDLVKALNRVGIETIYSCQDGDNFNRASILINASGIMVEYENRAGLRMKDASTIQGMNRGKSFENTVLISWKLKKSAKK